MFDFDLIEEIVVALINLIGFWLILWVYFANKNQKLNRWFATMTLFVILWVDFSFLGSNSENSSTAVIFYRLNGGSVALFLYSFFNFYVIHFLQQEEKHKVLEKIILFCGVSLSIISVFTSFIVKEVVVQEWGLDIVFGEGELLFNLYAFVVAIIVIGLLAKNYFQFSPEQKIKIHYFLIGTAIFVFANIIFNIIIPSINGTVAYQYFGDYSAIFLLVFTAYAIVKEKLFGVKIILTTLLVGFIAIMIAVDTLIFTVSPILQLFKGISLVFFLFLGRDLIKNVLEEAERTVRAEKLAQDLAQANASLEELIDMKNNFLHIVSHQLRTPLTAMRGFISMWQEGDFDSYPPLKMAEIRKRIANNADRLNNIVNDMVVAMETEGDIRLVFGPTDIEEVIKSNIEMLRSNFEKKKLYIRYRKTDKKLPQIEADPKYLSSAFMNLIDNAEKYTKNGGLKITISREGSNVKIVFADTGVGLNPMDKKMIFKKFSRGANSSLINPNGSGLGLYIIRQVVRKHGGKVDAVSEGEEKGTTFIVTLPIKQPVRLDSPSLKSDAVKDEEKELAGQKAEEVKVQ